MWLRIAPTTRSVSARGTRSRRRTFARELGRDPLVADEVAVAQRSSPCRGHGGARRGAARADPSPRPRPRRQGSGRARRRGRPWPAAPRAGRAARAGSRPGARDARGCACAPDGASSSDEDAQQLVAHALGRDRLDRRRCLANRRSVAGSIVSPRRPANRAARIRRRASSAKRSRGSPTARRTRASRSDWPPVGSTSVPRPASRSIGSHAIALIVKSRRARSSVNETPKRTSSGRRRSRYVPSARYEVTSTVGSAPIVTVPKRFSQVAPGKRATTSSGRAAVAASHSPRCASPRSRSRTAPPTIATSWPASPSVRSTARTRSGRSG